MSDSQDAMLTGLKVLDCGENVSAPYAVKLMAGGITGWMDEGFELQRS